MCAALLTSVGGTFALNVHMAPLSVLLQRAALLVAATAMVALEGLLYCEAEVSVKHSNTSTALSKYYFVKHAVSYKTDDGVHIGGRAGETRELKVNE